jgi:hypothetical protein
MKASACLLLALCCAAWAADSWDGQYAYTANYGKSAGGSSILLDYRITLSGQQCSVALDGFQTEETLVCTAEQQGPRLTLRFASHAGGALTNIHGVAIYQPGQTLVALERINARTLRTTWLGLRGLDAESPKPGIYFRKD